MINLEYDLEDLRKPLNEIFTQEPQKWNRLINYKALFGAMFANLERLFKGCFGQEIDMDCTPMQYELFLRVFPVIKKALEAADGIETLKQLCKKLGALRNACMHVHSVLFDSTLYMDARFMSELPNYSPYPYLDKQGRITLAGLFAILMCMANKEMVGCMAASGISDLCNKIGLFAGYDSLYGKMFSEVLEKQLGTDLEAEIRVVKGNDPLTALWGEYRSKVKADGANFEYYSSAQEENSIYKVRGTLTEEGGRLTLTINRGSFYHLYFPEEYKLFIDDIPYFVELANSVPPFMLIPYLFRKGIHALRHGLLSEADETLLRKLNKAKFYVDKNVNIILLGKTVSDQRAMSQAATPQALYCLLNLEHNLYWDYEEQIQSKKNYSTLAEGLKAVGVKQSLIDDAVALRNFFAHGSILGDYGGRGRNSYKRFELVDVIRVFKELVLALEDKCPRAHNRLMGDVAQRLAEQMADMKYKDYSQKWDKIIHSHRPILGETQKPLIRIKSSYLTKEREEELGWFFYDKRFSRYTVFEVPVDPTLKLKCNDQEVGTDRLYIVAMKHSIDLTEVLGQWARNGFECVEQWKNPLVRYKKFILK